MSEILIIVEDGSNVANANSYCSVEDVTNYANMRGLSLPEEVETLKQCMIDAMDYIEQFAPKFKGKRTYSDQELSFPRSNINIDGVILPKDEIHRYLKYAQSQLAHDSFVNDGLIANVTGYAVKREKIGPIETEYATGFNYAQSEFNVIYTKANNFLKMFIASSTGEVIRS